MDIKRAFAYYEPRCKDWFVESGEFVIEIGKSSREICQSIPVYVEGTIALPFMITENITIGQLMKHHERKAVGVRPYPTKLLISWIDRSWSVQVCD